MNGFKRKLLVLGTVVVLIACAVLFFQQQQQLASLQKLHDERAVQLDEVAFQAAIIALAEQHTDSDIQRIRAAYLNFNLIPADTILFSPAE